MRTEENHARANVNPFCPTGAKSAGSNRLATARHGSNRAVASNFRWCLSARHLRSRHRRREPRLIPRDDGVTETAHELLIERQVVKRQQALPQHLPRVEQVADVRAREPVGRAERRLRIQGPRIVSKPCILPD